MSRLKRSRIKRAAFPNLTRRAFGQSYVPARPDIANKRPGEKLKRPVQNPAKLDGAVVSIGPRGDLIFF